MVKTAGLEVMLKSPTVTVTEMVCDGPPVAVPFTTTV
jgi:hypothetical protein